MATIKTNYLALQSPSHDFVTRTVWMKMIFVVTTIPSQLVNTLPKEIEQIYILQVKVTSKLVDSLIEALVFDKASGKQSVIDIYA